MSRGCPFGTVVADVAILVVVVIVNPLCYLTTEAMKEATTYTVTLISASMYIGGYQFDVWKLTQLSMRARHDV